MDREGRVIKQVKAISKQVFDEHYSDAEFIKNTNCCFISILECNNTEQIYDTSIDNFLQVKMWDVDETGLAKDGKYYDIPSDKELKKIVKFVNRHKDKDKFIVHCTAGISRSGAVATFIKNKFTDEIDVNMFNEDNKYILPNKYILRRLEEIDNCK